MNINGIGSGGNVNEIRRSQDGIAQKSKVEQESTGININDGLSGSVETPALMPKNLSKVLPSSGEVKSEPEAPPEKAAEKAETPAKTQVEEKSTETKKPESFSKFYMMDDLDGGISGKDGLHFYEPSTHSIDLSKLKIPEDSSLKHVFKEDLIAQMTYDAIRADANGDADAKKSSIDPDVVYHLVGHAILDQVKPKMPELTPEQKAAEKAHNEFADKLAEDFLKSTKSQADE